MNLVQGMSYRLEGNYYWPLSPVPRFFQGKITILSESRFEGRLIDEYGVARVEGCFDGYYMGFFKTYDKDHPAYHGGSTIPISYSLDLSELGGWEGRFTFPEYEDKEMGFVTMVVVPWCDDWMLFDERTKDRLVFGIRTWHTWCR